MVQKKKQKLNDDETLPEATEQMSITEVATTNDFLIVAGSYERIIYGLEAIVQPESKSLTLKPVFMMPCSTSCIKTVAMSSHGKTLATGATDDTIRLFDLRKRVERGSLQQHEGTITQLRFHGETHMISASSDNTLGVFRCSDWALLKVLKASGSKKSVIGTAVTGVLDLVVHPSGRVALSLYHDATMRLWDLVQGTVAYTMQVQKTAERLCISKDGTLYAIVCRGFIEIYDMESGKLKMNCAVTGRIHDLVFISNATLLVSSGEQGSLSLFRIEQQESLEKCKESSKIDIGHTARVRALSVYQHEAKVWLITASSSGRIIVTAWKEPTESEMKMEPAAVYEAGARLTCLTSGPLCSIKK